jgi:transcriptional regulator with XRE-family HTH domain
MMAVEEIQAWLFQIEPLPGESLSHFLGRFRRSNDLTPGGLAGAAGFGGAIISRWEKFRFNPPPSPSQLAALAVVVGVEVERLMEMLPPAGMGMKMEPIRLCGACYGESPHHRIEWQLKSVDRCHNHQLRLLSECPKCGARFKVPALWVDGWCHRCFTPFGEMKEFQKSTVREV